MSLSLEIGATKDGLLFTPRRARTRNPCRRTTLELIFSYGYECCAFKHNICRDQLEVPDGMLKSFNLLPPKFFVNPRCPLTPTTTEAKVVEAKLSEAAKDLEESNSVRDLS